MRPAPWLCPPPPQQAQCPARPDVRSGAREALFSKPPFGQPPARSLPPSPSESLISCPLLPTSFPQPNLSAVTSCPCGSLRADLPGPHLPRFPSCSDLRPPRGVSQDPGLAPLRRHTALTLVSGVPGPLPSLLICPSPSHGSPGPPLLSTLPTGPSAPPWRAFVSDAFVYREHTGCSGMVHGSVRERQTSQDVTHMWD